MPDPVIGSVKVHLRSGRITTRQVRRGSEGGLYTMHVGKKVSLSPAQKAQLSKRPRSISKRRRPKKSRSMSKARRVKKSRSKARRVKKSRSKPRHSGYKRLGSSKKSYRSLSQVKSDLRTMAANPRDVDHLTHRGLIRDLKKKAYFRGRSGSRSKYPGTYPIRRGDSFRVNYNYKPKGRAPRKIRGHL